MAQKSVKLRSGTVDSTAYQNDGPISEQIAALAYALWQERGCPDGSADEDWYRAEQEIQARHESQCEIVSTLTRVRRNRRMNQSAEAS